MDEFESGAPLPAGEPLQVAPPGAQRKAFKASIRPAGRTLLLFMVVQQIGTLIFISIQTAVAPLRDPSLLSGALNPDGLESAAIDLSGSAWILTAFTVLAYLAVVLPWRKPSGVREDLRAHNKPRLGTMFKLTCVAVSAQLLYTALVTLLSGPLPSITNGMDEINEMMANPSSLIFASLLGPLLEELLFRGALISALKPHGKWYAILVSSILFGLFHANVPQAIFAFSVGLVLGYVAIEYSVWWSVALHIFNNFVLAQLPLLLAGERHAALAVAASGVLTLALGIAGAVLVIRKRGRIAQFLRDNPIGKGFLRWTFSQGYYLALAIFCGGIALLLLFR